MKKTKVSKTVKERFRITASGKLMHKRGGIKHRTSKERTSLLFRGRRLKSVTGRQMRKLKKLLGV